MEHHRKDEKAPNRNGQPETVKKAVGKKPYVSPVLVEYGTIAKLTQGTRSINTDGGNTMRNAMTCL